MAGTPNPDKSLFSLDYPHTQLPGRASTSSHSQAPNRYWHGVCKRTTLNTELQKEGSSDDKTGLRVGDAGIEPATPSV